MAAPGESEQVQLDGAAMEAIDAITKAEDHLKLMGKDFEELCQHRLCNSKTQEELLAVLGPAAAYKHHVLPQSIKTMTRMKDILELYKELTFDEWLECLDTLLEDSHKGHVAVENQKKVFAVVIEALGEKKKELSAKTQQLAMIADQNKHAAEHHCDGAKRYRVAGGFSSAVGAGLGVAALACPATWVGVAAVAAGSGVAFGAAATCNGQHEQAIAAADKAKSQECGNKELAAKIENGLAKRLEGFTETLFALAGFFENLVAEVGSMKELLDTASDQAAGTRKAKAHYLRYKAKANVLHNTCSKFISVVPVLRASLKDIPSDRKVEEVCIEHFGKIDD